MLRHSTYHATLISVVLLAGCAASTKQATEYAAAKPAFPISAYAAPQPTQVIEPTPEPIVANPQTIVDRMYVQRDEIDDTTVYMRKDILDVATETNLYPFVGQKKGADPTLGFMVVYRGSELLSVYGFTVVADGKKFNHANLNLKVSLQVNFINESGEIVCRQDDIAMMQCVAACKEAVIRLRGRNGSADVHLTAADLASYRDALEMFTYLGGRLPSATTKASP